MATIIVEFFINPIDNRLFMDEKTVKSFVNFTAWALQLFKMFQPTLTCW